MRTGPLFSFLVEIERMENIQMQLNFCRSLEEHEKELKKLQKELADLTAELERKSEQASIAVVY